MFVPFVVKLLSNQKILRQVLMHMKESTTKKARKKEESGVGSDTKRS